jgi:uncharacterized membrane protein YraQ (UPF0718 family)
MNHAHTAESGCHAAASDPQQQAGSCSGGCGGSARRTDWFLYFCALLTLLAYIWGLVHPDPQTISGRFSTGAVELFNRMWWGLLIGVFFVGLLARVPRELVMSLLGRRGGLNGMLRATGAGVLLDLCSHGILAVGMKLYERGATPGQVMAFLLASPWNSFSLTLILIALMGLGWTLVFLALSLLVGVCTGLVFDALVAAGRLPANPWREHLGEERPIGAQWRELRAQIRWSAAGLLGIVRDGFGGARIVIRWALFGLLLASALRAAMPDEMFSTWFGPTLLGLWLTLLAATVIEVCSEGSTPIAADLLNRAGAPGNAFTFLMAGVATDYTEIMSLRDTTGSWKIALCLPLVCVPQVMLLGWFLNQFA